ncbi:50S ribosomal protein L4 [Porphyromonas macacae]|uniref:Large ribosomal subunit protein uL4 n=1 Tax=Porphyromonas macacae TaxID=28115 RepID=A0A379DGJ9_9PORP|nr:50S ribosomal protein L4 [Porphyromonas macacae]KGN98705.1 50S ribosomal protein L4 [Porphyromonas macacae]SUB77084.1 50S ribosomal protein L4 [Porphyromonas macacae]SUB88536.1 50S ribosomal protein L4 [Porphyromonas macacae]
MELSIYNIKGEDTGRKINLNDEIFGIEPNDHAIYMDVKLIMANRRQGTHKAKERSEMSGSTRKLIRQKGGGGARRGDINSPLLVGGGRVFGPRPRNYSFKLNKKEKALARRSALAYKAKNEEIRVIENFSFDAPKTKNFAALCKAINVSDAKSLFVFPVIEENIRRSANNLPKASLSTAAQLNTYDVLNCKHLVLTEDAVAFINDNFKA